MADLASTELCELLPWDSEFWKFPIARVRGCTLIPERLFMIDRWCEDQEIACLYFLATFDDPATIRSAEDGGFRLVDARVTATISAARLAPAAQPADSFGIAIRAAAETDIDLLCDIASESYQTTRFYFDPHFPRDKCGLFYARWIAESCRGLADQVFVAELVEDAPVGYITCHLPTGETQARIGLLNVASQARRRGVGEALIRSSLDWFAQRQVDQFIGITQARNIAIQAFNDRLGFVTRSYHLWYHKWYRPPTWTLP